MMTEPVLLSRNMLCNCSAEKAQTHLIGRASGQDELAIGVEGQAVDLGCVGIHCVARLGVVVGPRVPAVPKQTKTELLQRDTVELCLPL